jgi:hypothetical protein
MTDRFITADTSAPIKTIYLIITAPSVRTGFVNSSIRADRDRFYPSAVACPRLLRSACWLSPSR